MSAFAPLQKNGNIDASNRYNFSLRVAKGYMAMPHGFDRYLLVRSLANGCALLLSITLASSAFAEKWTIRVKDAACLYKNSEQYRHDLESPMLIVPQRCPDTLASSLLGELRAEYPDIRTSSETKQVSRPDSMIVFDKSEFSCFLKLFQRRYGIEGNAGDRDDLMVFDTSECPTANK
jgi:hypothetical protein